MKGATDRRADDMTGRLRVLVITAGVVVFVLFGVVIASVVFPLASGMRQQRITRWWSRCLLTWCRVHLVTRVRPMSDRDREIVDAVMRPDGRGALLVMNHVSWLDIYVVDTVRAAHFIAKAEIAAWPVVGYLVRKTGTVFIERGKRHAVRDANQRIANLIESGELVGMFPEGTVSDGHCLLPFHANLIQPAVTIGAPVVVAGVRYRDPGGGTTDATLYTEGITLFGSLARIARHGSVTAELHLVGAIQTAAMTRHEVAQKARDMIAEALDFERDSVHRPLSPERVADVTGARTPARTEPGTARGLRDGSR